MKIAILDDYAGVATSLADWSGLGEVTVFSKPIGGPEKVTEALQPFDIVCVMRERTPLPASVIEALPNLKLIVTTGPRNASIDMAAARARGIPVCGTETRKTTTSELAMTLILALNRQIVTEAQSLQDGNWQSGLGRDLNGLTLGLVGLGSIGAQMAGLGRAFGMNIAAWSQNLTEARCAELDVKRCASLEDLMATSDVVSVHLILSERSRGLIGAQAFEAAKPGAVFVNTSRGPIVDSAALLEGLRAGKPAKAGIDVFDREPLAADDPMIDRALIDQGKLLLTPHLGYTTEATFRVFYGQTAEAIKAWQAGEPVRVLSPA
ncbi:D-2-hydroxyacid dehydrogenase family protein [Alkalilacustris brevis]|uniref:D-2-hydroxyacid dehydrogenase family protein n=1 Tax=Alkalilacustris brevis TaxID=2026338 RepID=UPI000E0D6A78|nr:D-2-hydroxyacid dehydrogenase family protein [Alkalilacustris brevis]